MIPYGHQFIDKHDKDTVLRVLDSDWLTQGSEVDKFENVLATYCGAKYAVAVNNGTSALLLAYLAVGLKKGDEVITTANTFVATSNMLLAVGAKPVFCDIRLDNYNIDEQKIEKLINKKTKAIVPVHFAGHPCGMSAIWRIAKKHKLNVIYDGAHALGAQYKGKTAGVNYGNLCTFSFHPVKTITTGEGGAIITNDSKIYKKLLLLRAHGIVKNEQGMVVMKTFGYNCRLTDFQCALGCSQMKKVGVFVKKRNRIAGWYRDNLFDMTDIILPKEDHNVESSWHLYVIRVKDPTQRIKLSQYLKKEGVGVNYHYPPVYAQPYYREHGYRRVSLLNTEKYGESCLTIPCYVAMTKKDVDFIAQKIRNFFE